MSTSYTVTVMSLDTAASLDGFSNVVIAVNWLAAASDGAYTARQSGRTRLGAPVPTSFIPFDNLTESVVKSWIGDPITPENKACLDAQLAKMSEPVVRTIRRPPWV